MDPLIGATLINSGAGILGGLGSFFGGSGDRKMFSNLMSQGRKMMRGNPLDVNEYTARLRRSTLPLLNKYGGDLDRSFGLDSGVGRGELFHKYLQHESGLQGNAFLTNAQMKQDRDLSLFSAMLGASAARA